MSRPGKIVAALSSVWFVVYTAYFSHRGGRLAALQFPAMLATLCFLAAIVISLACIFIDWKKYHRRAFLPFAICVSAILISSVSVRIIRRAVFRYDLPRYESVVQQMESGRIQVGTNLSLISEAKSQAPFAYFVLAQKDTNGALFVAFITEVGFPLKHSGYLYSSSDVVTPGSLIDSRWPIRNEVTKKWFYISY